MEFPGVFIKNHRSWFVTLEFPPTNKGRVFTRSRKSGKIKEFVRGSAKSQWENFYPCKFVTFKNIICTQKFVQLNCIWQSVVYIMLLFAFGIKMIIVRSPPLFSKGGGSKFWLPPTEGGIWKIKEGGGNMVQGQVFLKAEGRPTLFLSNFFEVYHFAFRNYFTLCKIVLRIWREIIFFFSIILWKKVILSCL